MERGGEKGEGGGGEAEGGLPKVGGGEGKAERRRDVERPTWWTLESRPSLVFPRLTPITHSGHGARASLLATL